MILTTFWFFAPHYWGTLHHSFHKKKDWKEERSYWEAHKWSPGVTKWSFIVGCCMDQCLGQDVEASKIDFNKIIACYLLVDSYMLVLLWTMRYMCHARVKHLQQIQLYHQSIFNGNTWLDSVAVSLFVDILVELSYTNTAASAPPREWYRIFKRTKIQEECFQAHFLED